MRFAKHVMAFTIILIIQSMNVSFILHLHVNYFKIAFLTLKHLNFVSMYEMLQWTSLHDMSKYVN